MEKITSILVPKFFLVILLFFWSVSVLNFVAVIIFTFRISKKKLIRILSPPPHKKNDL